MLPRHREMNERIVCDAVNCKHFISNKCERKRVNIIFDDRLDIYKCGDFKPIGEKG